MNAKEAWKKALETLQAEIPKAQFDTWVRDAKLIAFEEGIIRIGVQNAYARDWLAERLGEKITQTLSELLDQDVDVRFVLARGRPEAEPVDQEEQPPKPDIAIQAQEYETVYEQVVLPHRQVVVPGIFPPHLARDRPEDGLDVSGLPPACLPARGPVGRRVGHLCGQTDRGVMRHFRPHLLAPNQKTEDLEMLSVAWLLMSSPNPNGKMVKTSGACPCNTTWP